MTEDEECYAEAPIKLHVELPIESCVELKVGSPVELPIESNVESPVESNVAPETPEEIIDETQIWTIEKAFPLFDFGLLAKIKEVLLTLSLLPLPLQAGDKLFFTYTSARYDWFLKGKLCSISPNEAMQRIDIILKYRMLMDPLMLEKIEMKELKTLKGYFTFCDISVYQLFETPPFMEDLE